MAHGLKLIGFLGLPICGLMLALEPSSTPERVTNRISEHVDTMQIEPFGLPIPVAAREVMDYPIQLEVGHLAAKVTQFETDDAELIPVGYELAERSSIDRLLQKCRAGFLWTRAAVDR